MAFYYTSLFPNERHDIEYAEQLISKGYQITEKNPINTTIQYFCITSSNASQRVLQLMLSDQMKQLCWKLRIIFTAF